MQIKPVDKTQKICYILVQGKGANNLECEVSMKNIKAYLRWLWCVVKWCFIVETICLHIAIGVFIWSLLEPVGSCLDVGGVYDEHLKECRYDCVKWTPEKGCIKDYKDIE